MKLVKRYKPAIKYIESKDFIVSDMREAADGEYVRYDDIKHLMTSVVEEKKPLVKEYRVGHNHCSCHPETCCCNSWAIYDSHGGKHSTHYDKEVAKDLSDLLNKRLEEQQ